MWFFLSCVFILSQNFSLDKEEELSKNRINRSFAHRFLSAMCDIYFCRSFATKCLTSLLSTKINIRHVKFVLL